jgi:uncharacterized protein (TIGR02265 family)
MAEVVYDFAIRSLLLGLGDALTPQLRAQIKALGIGEEISPTTTYPLSQWVQLVELVAREAKQSHRELGVRVTRGFTHTPLGKLMKPAVQLMGVRRVLELLPHTFTMTNNFMRVKVLEASHRELRVELSHDAPSAEFLCGSIEEMARHAGADGCVASPQREGQGLVIGVRWT